MRSDEFAHLPQILRDAKCVIRELFGGTFRGIAFSRDPDEEMLWANIKTTLGGTEAAELLSRFDREWWLDNADRARGKLEFGLEFAEEATREKD